MVARTWWLWLGLAWLTETAMNASATFLCDTGSPCECTIGNLACDCSTSSSKNVVLVRSQLFVSISSISVANCYHMHVASNALSGLAGLHQVTVSNVDQITLQENAFNWTTIDHHRDGLVVNISNSYIQQIPSYCFQGYIKDILLSSTNISSVRSYAFGLLDRAEKIEFRKVSVEHMETQSFKRISVGFLAVIDSDLTTLQERTMSDVIVHQEVRFDNVNIIRLEKSSLKINAPRNFRLVKCTIGHIESNALEISTRGDVLMHDNIFYHVERHAFADISVEERYLAEAGKQDFAFENNTLVEVENASLKLNTSGFDPRLDWIIIKQKCSCADAKSWVDNLVLLCPRSKYPSVDRRLYCLNTKPISLSDYQRQYCNASKFNLMTVILCLSLAVISLSGIALVVFCGVRNTGKKYINVPPATSELRAPEDHKPHMLVVPDGKTYRETELHVILEHADAIKTTNYVKGRPDNDTND